MADARAFHTVTLLPGAKVLAAGGINDSGVLASAELYDLSSSRWQPAGSMSRARFLHTATALGNGIVLVTGGRDGRLTILASAEVFGPAAGKWAGIDSMGEAREGHPAS